VPASTHLTLRPDRSGNVTAEHAAPGEVSRRSPGKRRDSDPAATGPGDTPQTAVLRCSAAVRPPRISPCLFRSPIGPRKAELMTAAIVNNMQASAKVYEGATPAIRQIRALANRTVCVAAFGSTVGPASCPLACTDPCHQQRLRTVAGCGDAGSRAWTGSPDNPSAASAVCAIARAIGAASACAARDRAPRNA
jgi:hypothetical protein